MLCRHKRCMMIKLTEGECYTWRWQSLDGEVAWFCIETHKEKFIPSCRWYVVRWIEHEHFDKGCKYMWLILSLELDWFFPSCNLARCAHWGEVARLLSSNCQTNSGKNTPLQCFCSLADIMILWKLISQCLTFACAGYIRALSFLLLYEFFRNQKSNLQFSLSVTKKWKLGLKISFSNDCKDQKYIVLFL